MSQASDVLEHSGPATFPVQVLISAGGGTLESVAPQMTRENEIAMKVAAGMSQQAAEAYVEILDYWASQFTGAELEAATAELRTSSPELF